MFQRTTIRTISFILFILVVSAYGGNPHAPQEVSEDNPHIHNIYSSSDSLGNTLTIQNSYPKGGFEVVDASGTRLRYVVFFTNIINRGHDSVVCSVRFPNTLVTITKSPDVQFSFAVPIVERQTADEAKTDYGLQNIQQNVLTGTYLNRSLTMSIAPRDTSSFYILALSENGMKGPVRAGLLVENNMLRYTINGTTIDVGEYKFLKPTR